MFQVTMASKNWLYYKEYDVQGDHGHESQLYYKEYDVLGDHGQQELAVLQGV